MPSTDREVWDYLRGDPNTNAEIDLICYAIYAHEKYDWVEQFEKMGGKPPSPDEVDLWIAQITDYRFMIMRTNAAAVFDTAARAYLADDIDRQCQQAVDASILSAVKSASAFWKQATLALITAIMAPLIIGSVIVAARSYDLFYPTASDVSRSATPGSAVSRQP